MLALVVAACGEGNTDDASSDTGTSSSGGEEAPSSDFSACLITSSAGISDRSFNQAAWEAMTKAESQLGVEVSHLAQSGSTDFMALGQQFVDRGCSLIVGMGFDLKEPIASLAPSNPDIDFALVDDTLDEEADNTTSLIYQSDEASFLGGYLAAGMSKTGVVGVYGNKPIPPVALYMDGFVYGVRHYNEVHDADVKAIGWNPDTQKGQFVGSFTDVNKGKLITESQLQQDADVIFPVALPVGTAAAVREAGGPAEGVYMLWIDSDGCVQDPEYCDLIVSTVEKRINTTLYDVIASAVDGDFPAGEYVGTLENDGVGLSSYGDLEDAVPAKLKQEIEQLGADIAAGEVPVDGRG